MNYFLLVFIDVWTPIWSCTKFTWTPSAFMHCAWPDRRSYIDEYQTERIQSIIKSCFMFIGGMLRTCSRLATVGLLTSSKRQHCKLVLNEYNNQNFAQPEVWVYCWCRIVSIFLSDDTLLVIVDIYDLGLP